MRRAVIALMLSLVATSARAQVPSPAPIPASVSAIADLQTEHARLSREQRRLAKEVADQDAACRAIPSTNVTGKQNCTAWGARIMQDFGRYRADLAAWTARLKATPAAAPAAPDQTYRYVGNGLVGGTSWRTGYYSPVGASPEVRARAFEALRQQARLANIPFDESVDLERYNFVIGIAASTDQWTDLRKRVVFDQLRNGAYSRESQEGYNAIKGRRFDELGCHSNGAMICLAALDNSDVKADHVVLYGPQVTAEGLEMWNKLVAEGRIKSLKIYLNENDPVPAFSLLANRAPPEHAARLAKSLFFDVKTLRDTVKSIATEATIVTGSCGTRPSTDCHGMAVYTALRKCESFKAERVPGAGGAMAPPPPNCPR
ncbi:MAG: hypothetical protein ABL956_13815 [Hyphomonadaceae bacterium]